MKRTGVFAGSLFLASALLANALLANAIFFNVSIAKPAPSVDKILALNGNKQNGKKIYLACSLCHSPQGWGTVDGYFPQLSGQHSSVLIKQLVDIYLGNRDVPTMIPFADAVFYRGNQYVADVVSYIASLPMNPENGVGRGNDLKLGKKLYGEHCQRCHGEQAQGKSDKFYPLLQGQHYEYVLRQMRWIVNGQRKNGDAEMAEQLRSFSSKDMEAVADYISRIKPKSEKLATSRFWKNPDFDSNYTSTPWQRHNTKNSNDDHHGQHQGQAKKP